MHLILLQLVVLDLNRHLAKRNRHPMGNHLKLFPRKRLRQGHHHQGQIHKCKTVSNFHYYRLIYHDCSYLIKNNPKLVNLYFIVAYQAGTNENALAEKKFWSKMVNTLVTAYG